MKKSAFFGSILSLLVIASLAVEGLPAAEQDPSPNQTIPQPSQPQQRLYTEEALKKTTFHDLIDTDLVEIRGRRMTVGEFKMQIRSALKVEDPADATQVAMALNTLYKSQRYEIKLTYDDSELSRMMGDLTNLVPRDRSRSRKVKSSNLTGTDLRNPTTPPVAQKPRNFPESTRSDRVKRLKSQAQGEEELIDLRSKIPPLQKDEELKDGNNLIHTTPSGLRFTARVEAGRIIGWMITDRLGHEIKEADSGCWSCRETDGETQCLKVFCPKK